MTPRTLSLPAYDPAAHVALPGGAAVGVLLVLSLKYLLTPFSVAFVFLIIGKLNEKPDNVERSSPAPR